MANLSSTSCIGDISKLQNSNVLRIGGFRVEPATGRISHFGHRVKIEPRAMDVLMYLAARQGHVVSTTTLKRDVWGRVEIVDAAVKRCISQVRKAFGDDPARPTIIETVPKRGYRLIAQVVTRADNVNSRQLLGIVAIATIAAIALAIGFNTLTPHPVASNVLHSTDMHEIARTQYHRYDESGMAAAATIYNQLLEINPRDAVALAGLADTYMQQYLRWKPEEELAQRARRAALMSLSIDQHQADAYKALGAYHHFRGEPDQALKYYGAAVAIDPGYWTALHNGAEILRDAGYYEAAKDWFHCALAETPRKAQVVMQLADVEARAGNTRGAERYLNIANLLDPSSENTRDALRRIRRGERPFMDAEDTDVDLSVAADLRDYATAPCTDTPPTLLTASLL